MQSAGQPVVNRLTIFDPPIVGVPPNGRLQTATLTGARKKARPLIPAWAMTSHLTSCATPSRWVVQAGQPFGTIAHIMGTTEKMVEHRYGHLAPSNPWQGCAQRT